MIGLPAYLRIVRASAWYDLVVTAGFATPWTFALILTGLRRLGEALGLPGALPPFAPEHMLMANLLGSLVIVRAVLRLRAPQVRYGRYDAASRCLFTLWMLAALAALADGAHPLVWGFVVMEAAFGLAQMVPVEKIRSQPADETIQLAMD